VGEAVEERRVGRARARRVHAPLDLRRDERLSPRDVDARFIAATNRDLDAEVARGAFRRDLFFRLNGIALTVPPLRERTEEIEPLARAFVAKASREMERARTPALSDEALAALTRHAWPGNVRELRNAMERAVVLCTGDTIRPDHLPPQLVAASAASAAAPPGDALSPAAAPTAGAADPSESASSPRSTPARAIKPRRRPSSGSRAGG
jgi:two-component system response regulator AtoC